MDDDRYLTVTLGNDAAARRADRYTEAFGLSLTSRLSNPAPVEQDDPAENPAESAPVADAMAEGDRP